MHHLLFFSKKTWVYCLLRRQLNSIVLEYDTQITSTSYITWPHEKTPKNDIMAEKQVLVEIQMKYKTSY